MSWQNTTSAENNIRHLVYLLENAVINLSEGQEQMSWLIDFTGFSLNTSVPIRTARDIIYILQSHYPERLAIAFLYNPPRFFEAFYKVFSPAFPLIWFLVFFKHSISLAGRALPNLVIYISLRISDYMFDANCNMYLGT